MGRIGGLRKRRADMRRAISYHMKKAINAVIGRNRLVSLKMESVAVKWRGVSGSRKLSSSENFKDIFISPDLTRKQVEEDRKLRLKLKEIRIKGKVLDGVKQCPRYQRFRHEKRRKIGFELRNLKTVGMHRDRQRQRQSSL